MLFVKIGMAGTAILVVAILLNLLANALGLATWYDFLTAVSQQGIGEGLRRMRAVDYVFLIVLYPFMLGLAAYLAFYLSGLARP
jgi:hypothetical protein